MADFSLMAEQSPRHLPSLHQGPSAYREVDTELPDFADMNSFRPVWITGPDDSRKTFVVFFNVLCEFSNYSFNNVNAHSRWNGH